jgi:hypothetical protein
MPSPIASLAAAAAVLGSLLCPVLGHARGPEVPLLRVQTADSQEFNDPVFGYAVRFPSTWQFRPGSSAADKPLRFSLQTPDQGVVVVTVSRLSRRVTARANFERLAQEFVDPVVTAFLESREITMVLGSRKSNRSNAQGFAFWQGTSAVGRVMVSQHSLRFDTDFMVNIFYTSADKPSLKNELLTLDAVMASLVFAAR